MSVRVAVGSDVAGIQRVRRSVRENTLPDYSVISDELVLKHLQELGRGWVYEHEGRIVAFAIASLEDASIWALFVEPDWESLGLGRALHDTMLEWLRSRGATRATLGTDPETRAARFYETAGWEFTGIDDSGEAIYQKQLA